VLVFSGGTVVVLDIGDEQPLVRELFFEGNAVPAGQVWLARRAGSTAGRGGKRRPGGVAGRLTHRLRRRRHHRESPALVRDAVAISDTQCVTAPFPPPKKPKTRDFSLSATPRRSSSRAFLSSTQINLCHLVGRLAGCETFASVSSYK